MAMVPWQYDFCVYLHNVDNLVILTASVGFSDQFVAVEFFY